MDLTPEVDFNIPGYDLLLAQNSTRGVALYIREDIPHKPHDISNIEYQDHVWMVIEPQPRVTILLGCIYRSPNSSPENNSKLNDIIGEACAANTKVLVLGDFNYKEINWELGVAVCSETHPATKFLDCIQEKYLSQHVDKPTRFRQDQTPSTLDLVLSNTENLVQTIQHEAPLGKSDHTVLIVELDIPSQSTALTDKHNFYKGDYSKMKANLQQVDWKDLTENKSVDAAWTSCIKVVNDEVEKHVPKSSKSTSRREVWMTRETDNAISEKRRTWNRFQKTQNNSDHDRAREANCNSTKVCRDARAEFERQVVSELKSNPKNFWNYVSRRTTIKSGIGDLISPDGDTISEDQGKAELLNSFFTSVFTRENLSDIPEIPMQTEERLTDIVIDRQGVLKLLCALNETKSPGPDNLHSKVMKELREEIAGPLTDIFVQSLEQGVLPQQWKQAHVIPIFKKGKKTSPGNYRPVSLTIIACKLMEKMIRDEVVEHMNSNNLFTPDQYGFRSGRSCALQLLEVLEEWTAQIDAGLPIDCIYLDYKKAFDSVPH